LACAAEIAVRLSGILDFPTYAVDSEIGYIVKPNQSGKFLNKNPWAFNDRSVRSASLGIRAHTPTGLSRVRSAL